MPPNTVYVGRPTKWGNPFDWMTFNAVGAPKKRRKARDWYQDWIDGKLDVYNDERDDVLGSVRELTGKNLACWCPEDQPCHADILLQFANQQDG